MAAAPLQFTLPDLCSASLQSFLLQFFFCADMRNATPHFTPHAPLRPHKYPDRKALA